MVSFYFLIVSLTSVILQLQGGLSVIFPEVVHVVEGGDVLLKLLRSNPNQRSCLLKTPNTSVIYPLISEFAHHQNEYQKVKYFGGNINTDCGVRINNVTAEDVGYWRLTSISHIYEKVEGASKISLSSSSSSAVKLLIGTKPVINFGDLQHCTTYYMNNKYKKINVDVKNASCTNSDELDYGWTTHNSLGGSLTLFCNLKCKERLASCYFIRLYDQATFSMVDGTGNGQYSYFGDGLCSGHCGITIDSPQEKDYGRWQCIVLTAHRRKPLSSFISISSDMGDVAGAEKIQVWDVGNTVVLLGKPLTLKCRVETPISECSLVHPNGSTIVLDSKEGIYNSTEMWKYDGLWKYDGFSLDAGDCGGTLFAATEEESGIWKCQMKTLRPTNAIYASQIQVKVTKIPLTAVNEVVVSHVGDSITVGCQMVSPMYVMEYCSFKRPDGAVFGPLQNASSYVHIMEAGLCQLSIKSVEMRDLGEWTCTVKIKREEDEISTTTIIQFSANPSVASAGVGAAVGIAVLVAAIIGLRFIRRVCQQKNSNITGEHPEGEEIEMQQAE
ncbi:uncharacterized protein LOC126473337 [Schistocerca serialis cubense]|uniref:uncharacterized protein LOC126473337 n=1 Tax=Schistocerca serialis cubense TaxID=2023355 RepID=UPI00214E85DC|nr:uncharacterized protein LOC126473337 [Schistocerca serialis cubense]